MILERERIKKKIQRGRGRLVVRREGGFRVKERRQSEGAGGIKKGGEKWRCRERRVEDARSRAQRQGA